MLAEFRECLNPITNCDRKRDSWIDAINLTKVTLQNGRSLFNATKMRSLLQKDPSLTAR